MEFRAFFKHMDTSLPLYVYAEDKIKTRLAKYPLGISTALATFDFNHGQHVAHCHVKGRQTDIDVEASHDESMYAAVDALVDKLDARLRRAKEKRRNHRAAIVNLVPPPVDAIDASQVLAEEKARLAYDN